MSELAEQASDEFDEYERVRFHEARAAGLTRLEAARFAKGTEPLHLLHRLRADGCPPQLIARIVV